MKLRCSTDSLKGLNKGEWYEVVSLYDRLSDNLKVTTSNINDFDLVRVKEGEHGYSFTVSSTRFDKIDLKSLTFIEIQKHVKNHTL
jgi:hypothetical protein